MALENLKTIIKEKIDDLKNMRGDGSTGGRASGRSGSGSGRPAGGASGRGGAQAKRAPGRTANIKDGYGRGEKTGKTGGKSGIRSGGKVTPMSPSQARLARRANDERIIKTIKIIFMTIVVVAVAGILLSIFLYAYKPTIATVGGLGIAQYEFSYHIKAASQNASEYSTAESIGQQALRNAADMKILEVVAKERGITFTQEDRTTVTEQLAYIDQMNSSGSGINANMGGDAYLRDNFGISRSQFKKIMQSEIIANHLMESEYEQIEVPDEDALAKYDENIDSYDEATVRHILFLYEQANDDGTMRTREESEQLAMQTVGRIESGEDMAGLVQELSEDTDLTNEGIYTFKRSDPFDQAFLDWTFQPGRQIGETGICESVYGFHVMRLEDMKGISFEEAKEDIVFEIKDAHVEGIMDGWRNEARFQPQINQKAYDAVIAQDLSYY